MNSVLSLDQVRAKAPAAFATAPAPFVSDRYAHVTTANLLTALLDDGWSITDAAQSRSRRVNGEINAKHRVALTHPDLPPHREGDPQMLVSNAGDTTGAVRIMGGFFRSVCLNQNYVGIKAVGGVFHHAGKGLEDRIVASARHLRANFDKVISTFELWNEIELSPEQQNQFVSAAIPFRFPGLEIAATDGVNTVRRAADEGTSLWKTYQRTQESLIRGGFSATAIVRDDAGIITDVRDLRVRKITGLNASERINTGLWNLAEEIAQSVKSPALAVA